VVIKKPKKGHKGPVKFKVLFQKPLPEPSRTFQNILISHNAVIKIVLESQLPHQIVDLLVTITNYNSKLAILLGS
jgi:hypothetical protein